MDKLFSRLVETNFSELAGLAVDARIPVPEHLLNEMLRAERGGNQKVSSLQVNIHRENRVAVDLRTPMWPWPLNLKLKLFGAVDLSGSPRVRAFLENNVLLGKLGSMFKGLPPGITLYNDQVSVDLGPFLQPEHRRLLPLVKSVEIQTEEHQLILDIKIRRE